MDTGAQVVLWGSIVLVSASLIGSAWLVIQAWLDRKVLKLTGRNGPLKTLAHVALVQEVLRFVMLLMLLILFILATVLAQGEHLVLRRALILLVVLLISYGSIHGNLARRALTQALLDAHKEGPIGSQRA